VFALEPNREAYNNGVIDWTDMTPAEAFAAIRARPERPAIVVNHPRLAGMGFFGIAGYDRATGAGTGELWADDFDLIELSIDSSFEDNRSGAVADWFSLLEHGFDTPAVSGSDNHLVRAWHVGYPRTCMWFGHDDPQQLSAEDVRDAALSGNSVLSGGLLLTATGPGGERPSETVSAAGGSAALTMVVESPSWIVGDSLETIVNGETVSVDPLVPVGSGPSNRYEQTIDVAPLSGASRTWVVFHATGSGDLSPVHPGREPFAVSNPIFVE
jgi:hypothetical protein